MFLLPKTGVLRGTKFCQPFVAELENYKSQIEVNYSGNCEEYDLSGSCKPYKFFQAINLGAEIPYFSKYRFKDGKPKFGWGFNSVISSHMWWDPLEKSTSPILNTDYHLESMDLKFIFFLSQTWIRNFSFKFAPFNHESTHLGDELTMYRSRQKYPITRVNVSYEYSEFNFTINDPNGFLNHNHSLRMGIKYRINGSQDYYTVSGNEGDSTLAAPTRLKAEYYLNYNLIRNNGVFTGRKWVNVISVEIRNRPVYQYPWYSTSDGIITQQMQTQKRSNSLNMYFGMKYLKTEGPGLGIYLHFYSGLNPYGQFRNLTKFHSTGVSIILE